MKYYDYDPRTFRTIRKVLGVSLQELGDICHLTRQQVANIENGKCKASWRGPSVLLLGITLDGIAKEQGADMVTVVEILKRQAEETSPRRPEIGKPMANYRCKRVFESREEAMEVSRYFHEVFLEEDRVLLVEFWDSKAHPNMDEGSEKFPVLELLIAFA